MNIAVVGSRNWRSSAFVVRTLVLALTEYGRHGLTIISGGARGVDSLAAAFADDEGLNLIVYRPQWQVHEYCNCAPSSPYCRQAAFRRNERIIENADLVLAFQHNKSRGTQHSIDLANRLSIPVMVFPS